MKLKEDIELKNKKTNITYIITPVTDQIKIKLFCLYLIIYSFEATIRNIIFTDVFNKKAHVGIDYEFNQRKIALMQLNCESVSDENLDTYSYIWIVNPAEFDDKQIQILINQLMVNKHIYKILHGPDSLDIPYMYSEMFKNNKQTILDFTKKVLDTRFLCEYLRISIGEERKCSIYDALLYFGTISNEKYVDLVNTHDDMGPVQDISWNVHKMSSFHTKYALYDVLFLQHFLRDIFIKVHNDTPKYVNSYKYATSLIRFIFVERRDVTSITEFCKEEINPINNYMIKIKGKNTTLITIYNNIIDGLKLRDTYNSKSIEVIDMDFLLSVGYLKKTFSFLLKYIVYAIIVEEYDVYIKKETMMKKSLSIKTIYSQLEKYDFDRLLKLIKLFHKESRDKILSIYN
jgi:hypothetical protein